MRLEVHGMLRSIAILSFLSLVTLASGAGADATFALQWRDTGTQELTILPGDAAAGGQRTLDIEWAGFGVSVGLPQGSSLSFAGGDHWDAASLLGGTWDYPGPPMTLSESHLEVAASYGFGPYQEALEWASLMTPPVEPD
jgi:hypothetical protein